MRVLAGVTVSPAGTLSLHTPLLRGTLVPTQALQVAPAGVAVQPVLAVRVLDTAELAMAALVAGGQSQRVTSYTGCLKKRGNKETRL